VASLSHLSYLAERKGDWARAEQLLLEASRALLATRVRGASDANWHIARLRLQASQGVDAATAKAAVLAAEQIARWPRNLYVSAVHVLVSDRRREPDAVIWLAERALVREPPEEGRAAYVRILLTSGHVNDAVARNPFGDAMFRWPTVHQGLAELRRTSRDEATLNAHAALACKAGDRAVASALLKLVGPSPVDYVWSVWGGAALLPKCKQWLGLPAGGRGNHAN
jgi:hypothetical protein